jgi:release factor glutamine methyltransferase
VTDALVERLRAAGCVFAEEEAALLTESAGGDELEALVARRVGGEPLEQVLGFVDFCGRRFVLEPGVFVPRQRSALLVEEAVRLGGSVVVDLCCGCGALGLLVADRLGATLHAVDLDPVAVGCARRNGADALLGDLFDPLPTALRGSVDLVLLNAPYVPTRAVAEMPPEAREHEPLLALDGGPDGMAVQRRVLASATDWLAPTGHLLTETSTVQADRLAAAAASIDPAGAARLYATLKPRLEEAYRDLGYPQTPFDRTVERAIVLLLETPIVEDPVRVEPHGAAGYAFAAPELEGLTGAQKQLLRTGADNVRVIQSSLRAIAIALGIPASRLPLARTWREAD